ncbi:DNA translocase FtsK 4TM domain-containing protein [Candidatus Giovannonibacteria bacterium]|nr:DNA translocase FtsK 4TM domain-containing protein [Candidatus Giovannonibacteria bacterium]
MKDETKQSIFGIFAFALAILFTLAAFGKAGFIGTKLQGLFELLFGRAFFLIPLMLLMAGISFIFSLRKHFLASTMIGAILFLLSSLGIVDLFFSDAAASANDRAAGLAGFVSSYPFMKLFDFWAALLILAVFLAVGILIMLNISLPRRKKENEFQKAGQIQINQPMAAVAVAEKPPELEKMPEPEKIIPRQASGLKSDEFVTAPLKRMRKGNFLLPPLDLLEDDKGVPSSGDIKANSNIIRRTLQTFGIEVEMAEVNVGPSVTQYTLKPAEGVKLSRIVALQNDLALALAAHPLRIEAPIPGRSLVGIEIPNRSIALVGLRTLLAADEFQKTSALLPFALGRDVSGQAVYADLAKLPHLLIAGATGTGKSVAIHSILMSMLYKNPPEILRFIIIDPKRVELSAYSKIPHLLTPVITDSKKTILALKWAAKEMEHRYEVLAKYNARNISSYHAQIMKNLSDVKDVEAMPYLVIVIDELADIMATYPRELEAAIVRLAQMSRAVGIHLMLSTQRPSVEVITGLIKANITSRIALQVVSQVDSRTILDASGADKLLGNGDMLFLAGDVAKPRRIQGAFVSESEVKNVTKWLADHVEEGGEGDVGTAEDMFAGENGSGLKNILESLESGSESDDDLYEEARRIAIEAGKVSASYLQRRLRVGYARAARLLDMMEERGVIGPADGAKPREILMKSDDFESAPELPVRSSAQEDISQADNSNASKMKAALKPKNEEDSDFYSSF